LVLSEGGHLFVFSNPERFTAVVEEFLHGVH